MKSLFHTILFLLLAFGANAQGLLPVRLEVPSDIDIETFHVEPVENRGVLIFYESNEVNEDELRKWYFGLFNTKMKQEWLKFLPLPDRLEFIIAKRNGHRMHLLFKNTSQSRTSYGYYEIVNYNMISGEFSKVSGTLPEKVEVGGFEVVGNTACIALNLRNESTDLLFVNVNNGDINPVRLEDEVDSDIQSLYVDQGTKLFYVALKALRDKRYVADEIFIFNNKGEQEMKYTVENLQTLKFLKTYVFMPEGKDKFTVLGTYDLVTGKQPTLKDTEDGDEAKGAGMYFLSFEEGRQTQLKFHDFVSFDNIYGSLGNRQMEYNRSRSDNKNSGRSLTAFYHMLEPRIIKTEDQYIFSVEVYKPFYRTETRMDYDYYGRPAPYTYNIFDGYNFYDVIVAGISDNGDLIWNNDFSIDDLRSFSLRRNSLVFQDGNFITMAYVNEGKVITQTIEGPVDIASFELDIETKLSKDRVIDDQSNNIVHWYDDYYLIYGYQRLNNRTLGDQSTRTVFYANKIAYN
jgi:hypothetical protein